MGMRLHEIHASTIHGPLGLLPAAAAFDLAAAVRNDRSLARTGSHLWWAGSVSAIFAGLAGLAASQEVRIYEKQTKDALLVHGLGNTLVTLAALGLSVWRRRNPPTLTSALIGFGACAAACFTAWLGGEIVYSRGVGIKPAGGVSDSPKVLSAEAPVRFFSDAAKGFGWVLREGARLLDPRDRPRGVLDVSEP